MILPEFLITQISPFFFMGPDFPLAPCSQTPIYTRDQVSHPYRERGQILFFLIAVAVFVSILYDTVLCTMSNNAFAYSVPTLYVHCS